MNSDNAPIPLSPFHSIEVAESLRYLLERPRDQDFSLRTIARKEGPDGRELVQMQLVVAGHKTLDAHPLARRYPIHFLKSYHPWSFHGDPKVEFENHAAAAVILGAPEPIGYDANSIRTSFLPGKPLSRLSPFTNVEPQESCLGIAQQADPAALIGLWKLAEEAYAQVQKLHAKNFFHRDLELHNLIVCTAPVRVFLIDFESAARDFQGTDAEREELSLKDNAELLRLAIYLQSGLGHQEGPLAEASLAALPKLFRASSLSTFASRLNDAHRRAVGG
jgi:predicted Ser/Thr protein kinase